MPPSKLLNKFGTLGDYLLKPKKQKPLKNLYADSTAAFILKEETESFLRFGISEDPRRILEDPKPIFTKDIDEAEIIIRKRFPVNHPALDNIITTREVICVHKKTCIKASVSIENLVDYVKKFGPVENRTIDGYIVDCAIQYPNYYCKKDINKDIRNHGMYLRKRSGDRDLIVYNPKIAKKQLEKAKKLTARPRNFYHIPKQTIVTANDIRQTCAKMIWFHQKKIAIGTYPREYLFECNKTLKTNTCYALLSLIDMYNYTYGKNSYRRLDCFQKLKDLWKKHYRKTMDDKLIPGVLKKLMEKEIKTRKPPKNKMGILEPSKKSVLYEDEKYHGVEIKQG